MTPNVNVLVEAKQEYTNQLLTLLSGEIFKGIDSMFKASEEYCIQNKDKNVLRKFQLVLSKTPGWSEEKIKVEFERIKRESDCDYLEDLLTATFVSHTKILASIKDSSKSDNIEIDVPNGFHFIHKVYIECARCFCFDLISRCFCGSTCISVCQKCGSDVVLRFA